jgi:hypothetical protein
MTSEFHQGPLHQGALPESALAAAPAARRKTWREKRWERRRRRIWFEELLGWILVPVIVLGLYWATVSVLALFGTTPGAVIDGVQILINGAR